MTNYKEELAYDDYSETPSLYGSIRQRIRENASINQEQLQNFLGVRPPRRHASSRNSKDIEDEHSAFTYKLFKESASEHVQKFVGLRPKRHVLISSKSDKSSTNRKSASKQLTVVQEEVNMRDRCGKFLPACVTKGPKECRQEVEESRCYEMEEKDESPEERDESPSTGRDKFKWVAFLRDQVREEEAQEEIEVPESPKKKPQRTEKERNLAEIQESIKKIKEWLKENNQCVAGAAFNLWSNSSFEAESESNSVVDGESVEDAPGGRIKLPLPIGACNNSFAGTPLLACVDFDTADNWSDDESVHNMYTYTYESEADVHSFF